MIFRKKQSKKPIRLLFQDEARFGRISDRRRCWAPWPLRPAVGQQVIREFLYAMAAICPYDGKMASLVMPWVDAHIMSLFLSHTKSEFPNQFCVMVLDGAGWHRTKELRVPEDMALIFLPPYSPELNPVEPLWRHLRENHFGNRTFANLDEVENCLCNGLRQLHQKPRMVASFSGFDWIKTIPLTYN